MDDKNLGWFRLDLDVVPLDEEKGEDDDVRLFLPVAEEIIAGPDVAATETTAKSPK